MDGSDLFRNGVGILETARKGEEEEGHEVRKGDMKGVGRRQGDLKLRQMSPEERRQRKKTCQFLAQFFWPGIYKETANFCASFTNYQKVIPKSMAHAPLVPLPLEDTPFKRVGFDTGTFF